MTLEVAMAEERERRRIAAVLHDDVGHNLAIAQMRLGEARQSGVPAGTAKLLEGISGLIARSIAASRTLTFDLSSPILYELGLEAALRSLGGLLVDDTDIRFQFESDGQDKPLRKDTAAILFRMVRELIVNIIKHAHADNAAVSVIRNGDRIEIGVTDDGIGLDPTAPANRFGPEGRFGLFNIGEQLKSIGGCLEVGPAAGSGTRIVVDAPLDAL